MGSPASPTPLPPLESSLPALEGSLPKQLGESTPACALNAPPFKEAAENGNVSSSADHHISVGDDMKPWERLDFPPLPPIVDGSGGQLCAPASSHDVVLRYDQKAFKVYSACVVHYPCRLICFYLCVVFVICGLGIGVWRPFELNTDFSAFIKADGEKMRQREAYIFAYKEKKGLKDRRLSEIHTDQNAYDEPFGFDAGTAVEETEGLIPVEGSNGELFMEAVDEEEEAADPANMSRRLSSSLLYIQRNLQILYKAKDGNALTEPVLRDMRDLELELRSLPYWEDICANKASPTTLRACSPGVSLATVAYPTRTHSNGETKLVFDGKGTELFSLPALMAYLNRVIDFKFRKLKQRMHYELYFPRGYKHDGPPPVAIRSHFKFRIRVGVGGTPMGEVKVALEKESVAFKEFIQQEVYPILAGASKKYLNTIIYYTGDDIVSYEIYYTLFGDRWWAIASFAFVIWYTWVHTGGVLLSVAALFVVFLSIPLAYALTPSAGTTIASLLSIFLITGVGSDVVFVFNDMWNQSLLRVERQDSGLGFGSMLAMHSTDGKHRILVERVRFTMYHAGKSCLATSITTSVSFLANLASALQPLREFGLFMGLCVLCAFVLCFLVLPPILVIGEFRSARQINARTVDITAGQTDSLDIFVKSDPPKPGGIFRFCRSDVNSDRMPKTQAFLFNLVGWVSNCPRLIVAFTSIWFVCSLIGIVHTAEIETGIPAIFPPDHNQVEGVKMFEQFPLLEKDINPWCEACSSGNAGDCTPSKTLSECAAKLCDPIFGVSVKSDASCTLFWCHSSGSRPPAEEMQLAQQQQQVGNCYRGKLMDSRRQHVNQTQCDRVTVRATMVSPAGVVALASWRDQLQNIAQDAMDWTKQGAVIFPSDASYSDNELAVEDWDRGTVTMARTSFLGEVALQQKAPSNYSSTVVCVLPTYCYCRSPAVACSRFVRRSRRQG
jgi:hypothetical protein